MAYFEPNSTIKIMKGVPLDPSYDHTIYWQNEQARDDYFATVTKYTLTRQMYQRAGKGTMRVMKRAEDLYDCNYLSFQSRLDINGQTTPKWFFCFITNVEYINNEVSEISYEIDVMTTYFFDYDLGRCIVEREHSDSDSVSDCLVPEDIDVGEYIDNSNDIPAIFDASNMRLVVWSTLDDQYNRSAGMLWSHTYSGLIPHVFTLDTAGINAFISWHNGIPALKYDNAIVCMSVAPADFCDPTYLFGPNQIRTNFDVKVRTKVKRSDGSYVKNRKVNCYPYNYLLVTDHAGNNAEYRYEFFRYLYTVGYDDFARFTFWGSPTPNASITVIPMWYNISNDYMTQHEPALFTDTINYNETVTIKGFPMVSWNTDAFKAWLAQSSSSNMLSGMFAMRSLSELGRQASYSSTETTLSLAQNRHYTAAAILANLGAQAYKAIKASPMNRGNQGDFTGIESGLLSLSFVNRRVRPEYADIIDDYFTKYGYACHKLKVPNRTARTAYTYIKTVDCILIASGNTGRGLPAGEEEKIINIYNNGITFWRNPAQVGDYTVYNGTTV